MIKELIKVGESKTLEFKRDLPKKNQIAKTICAFANRAGGQIIIGISDDGEIIGLTNDEVVDCLERLPNIIHDSISPMLVPEISTYNVEGLMLVVVKVYPGSNPPYYIQSLGQVDGTYIRIGRTNKLADREMLKELIRKTMNIAFDEDIFDKVNTEQIEVLSQLLGKHLNRSIGEEQLKNLYITQEKDSSKYLNNGGSIILGDKHNTAIRCARFPGESVEYFIDRKDYNDDIFSNFESALAFCKNHIDYSSYIEGAYRRDVYEIPEEVLREGILNAIIHRDYSIKGADIKIAIFDTKIEITSPGGLPNSLSVEEIYAGRSELRNRVISRVFSKAGYVEQWGSGIPRIRSLCKTAGLMPPEIEEGGMFVTLRIFRNRPSKRKPVIYQETSNKTSIVKEEMESIISLLETNPNLTVNDLANEISISTSAVQRRLQSLQKNDQIERVGSRKAGYWKVKR